MAIGAIALGAFSAASSIMGAFGQQQQAEADVNYRNKLSRRQYQQSVSNWQYRNAQAKRAWNDTLAQWDARKQQYNFQKEENNRAATRAYYQNNNQLVQIQDRAKGDALDSFVNLMETNAMNDARGQTGRRAGAQNRANLMQQGIEMRRRADQLAYQEVQTINRNEDVAQSLKTANMNAWYNVSVAPQAPLLAPGPMAPTMLSAPSRMPMYAGLLGGVASGFNTAASLRPEGTGFMGRDWG